MGISERGQNSSSEASATPGHWESFTHGHEPHQADIGQHPANDFVGTPDNHGNPDQWTITDRTATTEDLRVEWITADHDHVEDLGEKR